MSISPSGTDLNGIPIFHLLRPPKQSNHRESLESIGDTLCSMHKPMLVFCFSLQVPLNLRDSFHSQNPGANHCVAIAFPLKHFFQSDSGNAKSAKYATFPSLFYGNFTAGRNNDAHLPLLNNSRAIANSQVFPFETEKRQILLCCTNCNQQENYSNRNAPVPASLP